LIFYKKAKRMKNENDEFTVTLSRKQIEYICGFLRSSQNALKITDMLDTQTEAMHDDLDRILWEPTLGDYKQEHKDWLKAQKAKG
jgi:predicted DNA-binding protein YlxM (UPF0122 family)